MHENILIVDDEAHLATMLADVLADAGYDAHTIDNGHDALEAVRRDPPDLMLLDVQMPVIDGFEVASRLKADPATAMIPIIMLSAMEGRAARVIGLESGAEEFLAKPFDPVELLARIHNLLALREHATEAGRHEHANTERIPRKEDPMTDELKTVPHVDLPRYLGTWYEIARKPMRHEDATARDITATYELDDDGSVRVVNSCLDEHGKVETAEGRAKPVDTGNAKLEVTFLPQGLRWIPFTKGDYWILRVDDAYATALVGEPDRKYLWLLHRQPDMPPAMKQEWLEFARMRGYDLGDVIFPAQSGQVHREADVATG